MSIIEVRNLTFSLNGRDILRDVSFSVERGEILVIIGPSGSGKSSILRCINRLHEPAAGCLFFRDQDVTTLPVTELRRQIGMIFQKAATFEGTVADNIRYGPLLHGDNLPRERLVELLELVSLNADLLERDATQLSGGQEQRLAIARALANAPAVLLLDEPTSALDPIATHAVENSLLSLRERLGLTMVWVSHSIGQARTVADRVLLLDEGRVVRLDSVTAMLDPQNGDKRALAFAEGDESGLHTQQN